MKRVLLLLFVSIASVHCFAQQPLSNDKGGTTAKNYYQEIPYEDINGKMIINVTVKGKAYRFLFDTGAPVLIGKEFITIADAIPVQAGQVTDVNEASSAVSILRVPGLTLGNVEFKDIQAPGYLPDFYKCWGVVGSIGSNLLRTSIVQIDSKKHVIILTDQPDKLSLAGKQSIPLILDTIQSDPKIKVILGNNSDMTLGFDTGDNGFLRIPEYYMTGLKKSNVFKLLAKGYGASQVGTSGLEKNNEKYMLTFPVFNVGDVKFKNVIVATSKNNIPGIGAKLLDYGIVTLDFINSKFYFDATTQSLDLNEKQWPFQPGFAGNQLTVGVVWEKGQKLVKLGEQIIDIDGTPFTSVDLCYLINKKAILQGKEKATVTVKSATGELRKVEMQKEFLK
ncbi:Aspartyl protease [Mucilaginibacter pineti]|uniref:Aspartyl protease n=1 Tax=Mucilaginibacter pineti TaxID=1391627 RepID=A0A1G7E1R5_9SPHI|nr:aspartyl protease family protein [Mucilaginibacter pineti]SDE57634.1 Aspartyl protease [Mucilaginibacter pineti]